MFRAVCKLLGVTQTKTTPYHPALNGQIKRFNHSLLVMIRCYAEKDQSIWDKQLSLMLAAYLSKPHQSTGVSSNLIMLGREVHQLTDLVFKDTDTIREPVDLETYLARLKYALETGQSVASRSLQICQYEQKRLYDLRLLNR